MNKIFFFIITLTLCSCNKESNKSNEVSNQKNRGINHEDIYNRNSNGDEYSLLIPTTLEKTNSLNELTSFQFQNIKEDFYVIVLDQPKKSFFDAVEQGLYDTTPNIDGYYKTVLNHFNDVTKNFKVYDVNKTEIDSLNAIVFSMSGNDIEDNYPVFYRYALIESDFKFYQIMSWTNIKYENKRTNRMNVMINSFILKERD